jgi:hypothetical protein
MRKQIDSMVKKAGQFTQKTLSLSYKAAKLFTRNRYGGKWEKEHQGYNKDDGSQLNREKQFIDCALATIG